MKLLILGGTVFLGRHTVEVALAKGHEVTIFNRGQHNPKIFSEVEKLRGDRDGDLKALEGRQWEAVIDTCGYVPRIVTDSARLLADHVGHYTFVSSLSVYADFTQAGMDESAAVGTLEDESLEEVNGKTYGPLKALCEQAAGAAMTGRVCNVRAGLIVGPHDLSDRFTYWPKRVAQGGEVLAPGGPDLPVQWIDVRDLAAWMVHVAEAKVAGTFNATGPAAPQTLGELLEACKTVTSSDAAFTWTAEEFLLEQEVAAFTEIPLWMPQASSGVMAVDISAARQQGLCFRPVEATIRDTLDWEAIRTDGEERRAGLSPEKENNLLKRWHARTPA